MLDDVVACCTKAGFLGNVAYDSIILIGTIDDCRLLVVIEFFTRFFGMFSRSGYMFSSFSMASLELRNLPSCETETDIKMFPYGLDMGSWDWDWDWDCKAEEFCEQNSGGGGGNKLMFNGYSSAIR